MGHSYVNMGWEILGARDVDAPPTSPSPKKDEVIIALLKMKRQPTKHLLKKRPRRHRRVGIGWESPTTCAGNGEP